MKNILFVLLIGLSIGLLYVNWTPLKDAKEREQRKKLEEQAKLINDPNDLGLGKRKISKWGLILGKDSCFIAISYPSQYGEAYSVTYKDKHGVYHEEKFLKESITILE